MTTMTWEQLQPHMDQMPTQITQLTTRVNAADEEHRRMHAELEQTKAQLTQANAAGGGGNSESLTSKV